MQTTHDEHESVQRLLFPSTISAKIKLEEEEEEEDETRETRL